MTGSANAADSIVGTWRLMEISVKWLDTNEIMHQHGYNPLGYGVFTPGGHLATVMTESGIAHAAGNQGYTDAERANYTGRGRH
jgi:hypothetical protein